MFRSVRRRVPWLVLFEAVMAMRRHWHSLPAHERVRLSELARKSGGRPHRLTSAERAEFRRIAKSLNLVALARDLAPFGRHIGRRR
jgi:predicted ArsR family transcriptional regulator